MAQDSMFIDTMVDCYIGHTSPNSGSAADPAEKKKRTKYSFFDGRYIFAPLFIETCGPWGLSAKEALFEIGLVSQDVALLVNPSLSNLRQHCSTGTKCVLCYAYHRSRIEFDVSFFARWFVAVAELN